MCVKEFLGYNCGHCSVPILRQCPLSASNPHYPVCKFPAERPIFTSEFCHPCSRVVWNIKVLKDEEEHRAHHLRGECMCEVIFEGEGREMRIRTRDGKGKSKSKGKEIIRGQQQEGNGMVEHGTFEQGMVGGEPGGYGGGRRDIEEYSGMKNNMIVKVENCPRQNWEPDAQIAAYEYVGYYINDDQNQGTDPEQSYTMAFGEHDQQGQLPMGQTGSGMKWYLPQLPPAIVYPHIMEGDPRGPRATSEPIGKYNHPGLVEQIESPLVQTQPMVVSSDMVRSESI